MDAERIEALSKKYSRWTKEGYNGKKYDRIYFNPEALGLKIERYGTGNLANVELNGNHISNCEGRRILAAKAFYDIIEDRLCIDSKMEEYFGDAIRAAVG